MLLKSKNVCKSSIRSNKPKLDYDRSLYASNNNHRGMYDNKANKFLKDAISRTNNKQNKPNVTCIYDYNNCKSTNI